MAIAMQHTFRGLLIQNAYMRVMRVELDRSRGDAHIHLAVFVNGEEADPIDLILVRVPYTVETGDIIEWAYTQLKALPEFADAIDA